MAKEIFYQGLLERIIWDPKKGGTLLEFDRRTRTYETDDEEIIALLRKRGYPQYEDLQMLERTGRLNHGGFEKQIADEKVLPSGRKPVEQEGEKPLRRADHVNMPEKEEKIVKRPPKEPSVEVETTVDGEQIIKRKKVPKKSASKKSTTAKKTTKKTVGKKKSTAKKTSSKKSSLKRRAK